MLRKIEKNAKSKEEALKLAAEEFGVSEEELSYTVEREVGKGLMGLLLGKEVIISAWITKEAEEEERRLKELAKKRAQSEKLAESEDNPYAPKAAAPHTHDYAAASGKKPKDKQTQPKAKDENAAKREVKSETEQKPDGASEQGEQREKRERRKHGEVTEKSLEDAKYFATELISKIGFENVSVDVKNGGDSIDIDVSGAKMGLLIGKRGDTLDAVQYLTSLYVNKAKNTYIKVNVDTEGYRAKREQTLVKLAKSLEQRALRTGSSVMLEPMSPNERRIIHAALQNSKGVKTYSVGEEPNRKVVVEPK